MSNPSPALIEALTLRNALANGYYVTHNVHTPYHSQAVNDAMRYVVTRAHRPFLSKVDGYHIGVRSWSGPTVTQALDKAADDLGLPRCGPSPEQVAEALATPPRPSTRPAPQSVLTSGTRTFKGWYDFVTYRSPDAVFRVQKGKVVARHAGSLLLLGMWHDEVPDEGWALMGLESSRLIYKPATVGSTADFVASLRK